MFREITRNFYSNNDWEKGGTVRTQLWELAFTWKSISFEIYTKFFFAKTFKKQVCIKFVWVFKKYEEFINYFIKKSNHVYATRKWIDKHIKSLICDEINVEFFVGIKD